MFNKWEEQNENAKESDMFILPTCSVPNDVD
jgi:hypothetical protein